MFPVRRFTFYLLLVPLFCIFWDNTLAQNSRMVSLNLHSGIIADKHDKYDLLIRDFIHPVSLSLKIPAAPREWTGAFESSWFGVSLFNANLGNRDVLGSLSSVDGSVNVVPFKKGGFYPLLGLSLGVSYASNPYHATENYRNVLIGSRFLATFGTDCSFIFLISPTWSLQGAIYFRHFSNGQIRLPNYGLNMITLAGGINYHFEDNVNKRTAKQKVFSAPDGFGLYLTTGMREIDFFPGRHYSTYSFALEKTWKINTFQHVGAGFAIFYDESNIHDYERKFREKPDERMNYTGGFFLTHELAFYPVYIPFQLGWYAINNQAEYRSNFFNRFGLRYFINKHLCLNITHKSDYFFRGDNIEWGIGYKF